MISDVKTEKALFDAPEGVILESLSGETPVQKIWEDKDVRIEMECGDELFPAMAWI